MIQYILIPGLMFLAVLLLNERKPAPIRSLGKLPAKGPELPWFIQ